MLPQSSGIHCMHVGVLSLWRAYDAKLTAYGSIGQCIPVAHTCLCKPWWTVAPTDGHLCVHFAVRSASVIQRPPALDPGYESVEGLLYHQHFRRSHVCRASAWSGVLSAHSVLPLAATADPVAQNLSGHGGWSLERLPSIVRPKVQQLRDSCWRN